MVGQMDEQRVAQLVGQLVSLLDEKRADLMEYPRVAKTAGCLVEMMGLNWVVLLVEQLEPK